MHETPALVGITLQHSCQTRTGPHAILARESRIVLFSWEISRFLDANIFQLHCI